MSAVRDLIDKYLEKLPTAPEDSRDVVYQAIDAVQFKKGDMPIREGERHGFAYFITKGAARSYYLKEGLEVNTWFAFENEFVGSLQNYRQEISTETVEFMEDSECLRVDLALLKEQQAEDIFVSNFVCAVIEEYALFLEEKLRLLQHKEGIERYLHVVENEPYLLQRVPLGHLASYLGIARETLSRLRSKLTL